MIQLSVYLCHFSISSKSYTRWPVSRDCQFSQLLDHASFLVCESSRLSEERVHSLDRVGLLIILEEVDPSGGRVSIPARADYDLVIKKLLGNEILPRLRELLPNYKRASSCFQVEFHDSVCHTKAVISPEDEHRLRLRIVHACMALNLVRQVTSELVVTCLYTEAEHSAQRVLLVPATYHIDVLILFVHDTRTILQPGGHRVELLEAALHLCKKPSLADLVEVKDLHAVETVVAIEATHHVELALLPAVR